MTLITDPEQLEQFRRIAYQEGEAAARKHALRIEEEDGTPAVRHPRVLRVTNGDLTHNADGTLSLDTSGGGGGGGGAYNRWEPDAPPATPSAEDDEFDGAEGAGAPTGWTEVDFSSETAPSEEEYGLSLVQTSGSGDRFSGVYKAIPSGDFTYWCKIHVLGEAQNYAAGGLALWQDATDSAGDLYDYGIGYSGSEAGLGVVKRSNYTTFSSTLKSLGAGEWGPWYLRVRRAGTTYKWDYSPDGIAWMQFHSSTISWVPLHIGPFVTNNGTGQDIRVVCSFWRYVASDVGADAVMQGDRVG
jgi:hypothetical protein